MDQVEGDAQPEEARVGEDVPRRRRRVSRHHQPVLDGEVGVDRQRPTHQQRHPRQPGSLLLGSIRLGIGHGRSLGGFEPRLRDPICNGGLKDREPHGRHPQARDMGARGEKPVNAEESRGTDGTERK